jgi:hypothetical protein
MDKGRTKMKKIMAAAMAMALVGGLYTYAAAGPGRGGGYGQGRCWQDGGEQGWNRSDDAGEWRGRGQGRGDCGGPGYRTRGKGIEGVEGEIGSGEEASAVVNGLLERRGNPYLKVGTVTESGRDYEVEIVTREGSLANKVYVEKQTGRIIPAFK